MAEAKASNFLSENETQLKAATGLLETIANDGSLSAEMKSLALAISAVLKGMLGDPAEYSLASRTNLEKFGNRILEEAANLEDEPGPNRIRALERLAIALLRIVVERAIRKGVINPTDEALLRLSRRPSLELEPIWSLLALRQILLEDLSEYGQQLSDSHTRFDGAKKVIKQWDDQIKDYETRVSKLLEDYNFVGFAKAFSEMRRDIVASKNWALGLMIVISLLAFIPPIVLVIAAVVPETAKIPRALIDSHERLFVLGPALVTYEILCVYFSESFCEASNLRRPKFHS